MPPLGPEAYKGIPKNEARIALIERQEALRRTTYDRMKEIVEQPRLKVENYPFSFHVHYETPKAVYQTEGQDDVEYTRAWLYFGPNGNTGLNTDRIRAATDGGIEVINKSRVLHFILTPLREPYAMQEISAIELSGQHYYKFDVEQQIDLWSQVSDTLNLIQAATEATGSQHIAPYPEEPWPTLALPAVVN